MRNNNPSVVWDIFFNICIYGGVALLKASIFDKLRCSDGDEDEDGEGL